MMKFTTVTLFVGVSLFLSCCGGTRSNDLPAKGKGNDALVMKYGGKEVSFEPTYSRFATFKKGLILKDSDIQNTNERVPAVVHRIYLANYDLQLTNAAEQDYRRIDSEGQHRVAIQLEAGKMADENARLRVGEYVYKRDPFERISHVFMSYFKDGSDYSENLQTAEFGGKVTLTSVTDSEITGEIDVFDKDEFVKGKFKAQRLIR